jgi:membrane-associated phospholipid phosphatase
MNKRSIIFATISILMLALYLPLNRPFGETHSFEHVIDGYIPLLTIFVIPYISYYFFLIFTFMFFLKRKNSKILETTSIALIIVTSAAYLFYFFYQNSIQRPMINPQNIFDQIYLWINSQVAPFNAFPSLHVAVSLICLMGIKVLKTKWFPYIGVWVLLIILSTVFTKQHYFLDVVGGLILAVISFALTKKILK